MKLYFKLVGLIIYIFTLVGFVLPYLLSAKSTELPVLGVLLGLVSIPLVALYIKKFILNQSK
ncbi:hypothetical protein EKK58_11230 [Candidatus Dependentiae bacterium]|nr:MAG: hypothetical protein EKK58_11230 [Candidatus Dependentiae bacterium]